MNITFNSFTPEDKGAWLATRPVPTHSDIKGTQLDIPKRDGVMYADEYRGDMTWQMTFHLKDDELEKRKRKVRQWLSGTGVLIMSDTPDSFYEVKRVILTEDYRKSMEYGRITAQFICYPYEFMVDGDTGIVVTGSQVIANEHDPSMPLYKIVGNGSGTLTVNNKAMTFSVATADNGLYIDTRKFIAYSSSGNNKNGVLNGEYEDIRFITGNNNISITNGFTLTVCPRWGYVI